MGKMLILLAAGSSMIHMIANVQCCTVCFALFVFVLLCFFASQCEMSIM